MKGFSNQEGQQYTFVHKFIDRLPIGTYEPWEDHNGLGIDKIKFKPKEVLVFPGSKQQEVLNEIEEFWGRQDKYRELEEPHKRGYLFYGPQGCGKTFLINKIISEFISKQEGVVFYFNPSMPSFINQFFRIEPNRKVIIVIEDIDYWLEDFKTVLLNLLDGALELNNTIILGTTNYIERLPQCIKNRPSRFDRKEKIGFPKLKARKMYFKKKLPNMDEEEISKWAEKTENFTIAHIKELIVSSTIYDNTFEENFERIQELRKCNESSEDDLRRTKSTPKRNEDFYKL